VGTASKKPTSPETKTYPSRRALRYQQRQAQTRRRIIAAVSAGLLIIAVVLVVVVSGGSDGGSATKPFDGSTLNITLGDYVILGDLTAPAGPVRLQAANQGGIVHNVGVRGGPISGSIQPGKSATLILGTLRPGTYQLYCDIVGHVEKGMVANLVITEPVASTTVAPSTT
jgi:Sulfocyanin (SoxE) domain